MREKIKGFTLLEVMIYVVLSMMIILGITSVVAYTKKNVNVANAINRVQDTGRNTLSLFDYQLQNAGFAGFCSDNNITSEIIDLNDPQKFFYNLHYPIIGWEDVKPNITALKDWAQDGDIVLIQYASSNNDEYKNATDNNRVLISTVDKCEQKSKSNEPSFNELTGYYVLHSYLYYLAKDDDSADTFILKRLNFDTTQNSDYSNPSVEEIAKGIQKFQVRYSISKNSQQQWLTAKDVRQKWNEVNAVQISFIVVDSEANTLANNKKFNWINDEGPIVIAQGRAADLFIKTISIRNRLL